MILGGTFVQTPQRCEISQDKKNREDKMRGKNTEEKNRKEMTVSFQ